MALRPGCLLSSIAFLNSASGYRLPAHRNEVYPSACSFSKGFSYPSKRGRHGGCKSQADEAGSGDPQKRTHHATIEKLFRFLRLHWRTGCCRGMPLPKIYLELHQKINRNGIGGGRLPGPQLSSSTLTSQEYGSSAGHLPGLADRTPSRKSLNPSSNSARAFSGPCDGSLQNTSTTCRQKHHFLAVHQGMAWKYVVTSVLRPLQWHLVSATSNVAFAMLRSKP